MNVTRRSYGTLSNRSAPSHKRTLRATSSSSVVSGLHSSTGPKSFFAASGRRVSIVGGLLEIWRGLRGDVGLEGCARGLVGPAAASTGRRRVSRRLSWVSMSPSSAISTKSRVSVPFGCASAPEARSARVSPTAIARRRRRREGGAEGERRRGEEEKESGGE
eukprot:scaffold231971_cov32-Tisochrysis_lutea.AAC.3